MNLRFFALLLLVGFFVKNVYAQSSDFDTFRAEIRIREAAGIGCGTNMKFPDAVAGEGYNASTIHSNTSALHAGFAGGNDARCTVSGDEDATFDVSFQGGPTWYMSYSGNDIPITGLSVVGGGSGLSLPGGQRDIDIRGVLGAVAADRPAGTYVNTGITVEVTYNL